MAYAVLADMIDRYGSNELIRLTTPDGEPLDEINAGKIDRALADAGAMIDTYLRKRYQVPVVIVLAELRAAACKLARYDLSFGEQTEPTEQMRLARRETITWLEGVRDGKNVLDGLIPSGDESFAQMSDRGFTTFADDGDPIAANSLVNGGTSIRVTDQSFQGVL